MYQEGCPSESVAPKLQFAPVVTEGLATIWLPSTQSEQFRVELASSVVVKLKNIEASFVRFMSAGELRVICGASRSEVKLRVADVLDVVLASVQVTFHA
jgi:hypothetical protein